MKELITWTSNNIVEILKILVPSLTSIFLVYLALMKDNFISKRLVYKERVEKFYSIFYVKYNSGLLMYRELGNSSIETISVFFDLISANIYLIEPKSQQLYFSFYLSMLDVFEARNGNKEYNVESCEEKLTECFDKLTEEIIKEYKFLCKKLRLPKPIDYTKEM